MHRSSMKTEALSPQQILLNQIWYELERSAQPDADKILAQLAGIDPAKKENRRKVSEKSWRTAEGRAYFIKKDYKTAIDCFKKVWEWQTNRLALLNIARCHQALGEYDLAIKTLNFFLNDEKNKSNKVDVAFLIALARCLAESGKNKEAINTFTSIPNWEKLPDVVIGVARCYENEKDYDNAAETFKKLPDNYQAILGLARCLQLQKKYDEAEKQYKTLLEKWPETTEVYLSYSRCLEEQNKIDEKLAILEKCPNKDDFILSSLLFAYIEKKDWAKAQSMDEMLIQKWPSSKETKNAHPRYLQARQLKQELLSYSQTPEHQNDTVVQLNLAHTYYSEKNYVQAIAILNQPDFIANQKAQLLLANCYKDSNRFAEAEKLHSEIIHKWPESNQAKIALAHFYRERKEYEKSFATFFSIKEWKEDQNVLAGLAQLNMILGNYGNAKQYYDLMPNSDTNRNILLYQALIKSKTKDYRGAEEIYRNIPGWERDVNILFHLASCYEGMHYYFKANEVFLRLQALQLEEKDKQKLLQRQAYVYSKMGLFDQAVEIYRSLLPHDKDPYTIRIGLAITYTNMGNFSAAIAELNQIPNLRSNVKALPALARYHCLNGNVNESIKCLLSIPGVEKSERLFPRLIEYYAISSQCEIAQQYFDALSDDIKRKPAMLQAMAEMYITKQKLERSTSSKNQNNLEMAESYFKRIPNCGNLPLVLIELALLYEMQGKYRAAEAIYQRLIKDFPDLSSAHALYCHFLLSKEDPRCSETLKRTLRQFPHEQDLYLLLAEEAKINRGNDEMYQVLMDARNQFPYNWKIYLKLIHYYISNQESEKANALIQEGKKTFPGFDQLFQIFDKLLNEIKMDLPVNPSFSILENKIPPISLPAHIQEVFNVLPVANAEYLLGGSTVINLIRKNNIASDDLDFVTTVPNQVLTQEGYCSNPYIPQLFTKPHKQFLLELYAVKNQPSWLSKSTLARDFTVRALFCNSRGEIFDPTYLGIQDLQNNILRAIGNPFIRLQEDPTRVIIAIEYLTRGFTPAENLHEALLAWEVNITPQQTEHLHNLVRKYLTKPDREIFVEKLNQYGLLLKLFGVEKKHSIGATLTAINTILYKGKMASVPQVAVSAVQKNFPTLSQQHSETQPAAKKSAWSTPNKSIFAPPVMQLSSMAPKKVDVTIVPKAAAAKNKSTLFSKPAFSETPQSKTNARVKRSERR